MDKELLKKQWLAEEEIAHIHGWDFSHIEDRYEEEGDLPWDYKERIMRYLRPEYRLLDIDTGGGEFLLTLNHPHENTWVTEAYPPNAALCREVLSPLGIHVYEAKGDGVLPFEDEGFHMVIDRHGDFDPEELFRILKPGGIFLTQQVGRDNDRELVDLLLPGTPIPFPDLYGEKIAAQFKACGFRLIEMQEAFRPIKFYDVGALVWFARIIQWEFPQFSVEYCLEKLFEAQEILEREGCIAGRIHRILLIAQKTEA